MSDDSSTPSPSEGTEGTVRRNFSETGLNEDSHDNRFDPYKTLERSQSDASLVKDCSEVRFTVNEGVQSQTSSHRARVHHESHVKRVSESSKVYYDLSKASGEEDQDIGVKIRREGAPQGAGAGVKFSLETIPQKEELKIKSSHRSLSSDSNDSCSGSTENLGGSAKLSSQEKSQKTSYYATAVTYSHGSHGTAVDPQTQKKRNNFKALLQSSSAVMKQKVLVLVKNAESADSVVQQDAMNEMLKLIETAWATPVCGRDLAYSLSDVIRTEGGLDVIIKNCSLSNATDACHDFDLLKTSARLLDQIMTTENRHHVVQVGLKGVVTMAVRCKQDINMAESLTGILESLFKHSKEACRDVLRLGGLDVILYWCRTADCTTLRHCAISLANLAIYSGPENQHEMIKQRVPDWLFPLAFSSDDSVKYYACLAIATLVTNQEIEAEVIKSGTMELVLPFISSHNPAEFANYDSSHVHGRSKSWLRRLVPVLCSKREEAQSLAAFHFAMEAGIKARQNKTDIFYDIGAIEPLKKLASSPNATASKLAAEALQIIGERVPHQLRQQVPLWTVDDVVYWVSQIGFEGFADEFRECCVDGDLLLLMTDSDLRDSIGMVKSITRKRFLRELRDLKITANYAPCDHSHLDSWLISVDKEFSRYTYQMLQNGVERDHLRWLTDENLRDDCHIRNGIHRRKILDSIRGLSSPSFTSSCSDPDRDTGFQKCIDVFISYRRSNGSQLASLLKVHLQLRGFSVFLDIERLRAGKFDEGLLKWVRSAKHFILVLTPNALDRCVGDNDCKDWVHKEVAAALDGGCNIVPLYSDFHFPAAESLPEDIRSICSFNAIRWIHDYQDACVDKLESFLRGDYNDVSAQSPVIGSQPLVYGDSSHGVPTKHSPAPSKGSED